MSLETKGAASRDALKVHLEVFKHLTTLGAALILILVTLADRIELLRTISAFGIAALALNLLFGVVGLMLVPIILRHPRHSRLAFLFSEALLLFTCIFFLSSLLTVLDGGLKLYGRGLVAWLRAVAGL